MSLKPMYMRSVGGEATAEFITYIGEYNYLLVSNGAACENGAGTAGVGIVFGSRSGSSSEMNQPEGMGGE